MMKNLKIFLAVCIVALAFSLDASAFTSWRQPTKTADGRTCPHPGAVGAPLDGGLLTILGAAGIAYFVARKKKKI